MLSALLSIALLTASSGNPCQAPVMKVTISAKGVVAPTQSALFTDSGLLYARFGQTIIINRQRPGDVRLLSLWSASLMKT